MSNFKVLIRNAHDEVRMNKVLQSEGRVVSYNLWKLALGMLCHNVLCLDMLFEWFLTEPALLLRHRNAIGLQLLLLLLKLTCLIITAFLAVSMHILACFVDCHLTLLPLVRLYHFQVCL